LAPANWESKTVAEEKLSNLVIVVASGDGVESVLGSICIWSCLAGIGLRLTERKSLFDEE